MLGSGWQKQLPLCVILIWNAIQAVQATQTLTIPLTTDLEIPLQGHIAEINGTRYYFETIVLYFGIRNTPNAPVYPQNMSLVLDFAWNGTLLSNGNIPSQRDFGLLCNHNNTCVQANGTGFTDCSYNDTTGKCNQIRIPVILDQESYADNLDASSLSTLQVSQIHLEDNWDLGKNSVLGLGPGSPFWPYLVQAYLSPSAN